MLRKIFGSLKSLTRSLKGGTAAERPAASSASGTSRAKHEHGRGHRRPKTERDEPVRAGGERSSTGASRHGGRRGRSQGPREEPRRSGAEAGTEPRAERPRPAPEAVAPVAVPAVDPEHPFRKLGLGDSLVAAIAAKGYTEPTPIQVRAIPVVLSGRDLIGTAQTGTGKTAAFALPIMNRLGGHGRCRCLVLEPTRELALQVEEAFRRYGQFTNLRVVVVYGGVGYGRQREDLQRGVDIIVATPGRLLDLLGEGVAQLRDLEFLVLDEVDRMLDMGFLPDVRRIIRHVPARRQTLLFSATLPPEIQGLAQSVLTNPETVEIGLRSSPAETVDHAFYPVVATQKFDLLITLLERTQFRSVIVFSRTKMGADRIAHRLKAAGHTVGVMHADRSQRERTEALDGFKSGKYELLVATDLAARGLDIRSVTHVINYDMPENPEDYVHRIGRTGRANDEGDAFTLMTEENIRAARAIERLIGRTVPRRKIENFDYLYSALFDDKADATPRTVSRLHRGRR